MIKDKRYAKLLFYNFKSSLVVAEKDARIYYLKPPVIIFGILFPVFFFLAFSLGREIAPDILVPGLVGMTLFFTSSSVGPLITPWERNAKTYERLLASPLSLSSILFGDMLAGVIFGVVISLIPVSIGIFIFKVEVFRPFFLAGGIILSAFCFSSLGALLASPATEAPSQIMMLSALVRFPLIFISGIFIPVEMLPLWGKIVAFISPLTYTISILRHTLYQTSFYPSYLNLIMLFLFSIFFFTLALHLHRRNIARAI